MQTKDILKLAKGMAATVGEKFEPQEDWLPMLFVKNDEGVGIVGLAVDGGEEIALAIAQIGHRMRPQALALIHTAWMVVRTEEQQALFGRIMSPSEDPDRIETLCISAALPGEPVLLAWSPITRHADAPPSIGEWNEGPDEGGRLAEAMADALAHG